jgi:hypothetical protein
MSDEEEREAQSLRLLQTERRDFLEHRLASGPWVVVYRHEPGQDFFDFFSALIPPQHLEDSLSTSDWDLTFGQGEPGFITYGGPNNRSRTRYLRFGNDEGVEPLVLVRSFPSSRPNYVEVSEEFRLFFNLFHETKTNALLWCDTDGNEEEAVLIDEREVKIKLRFLLDFMGAKRMDLLIFFEGRQCSPCSLEELGLSDQPVEVRETSVMYDLRVSQPNLGEDCKSFSLLRGKAVIRHPNKRLFGPRQKEPYCDFIIGTNPAGQPICRSCDPSGLPPVRWLTPVFFRREVLQKYYDNPQRYSVEDGYLRCGGLWGMQIDNSHQKFVVAFLGDLGQDLSLNERHHWLSHNVAPEGGMSRTSFARSFEGRFTMPEMPDLLFKQAYERLNEAWEKAYNWPLFKPLNEDDEHIFKVLRIPLNENHNEFDTQVLNLAKVLVDSLNEMELAKGVSSIEKTDKGITKLEKFVAASGWDGSIEHIAFLRRLQALRSSGAAHRKGKEYRKAAEPFQIEERGFVVAAHNLFGGALRLMSYLESQVRAFRGSLRTTV